MLFIYLLNPLPVDSLEAKQITGTGTWLRAMNSDYDCELGLLLNW